MKKEAIELIQKSLRDLTDFQGATVEAVYKRFVQSKAVPHRVLVADEVGLGKTLVAKGVIGRMLTRFLSSGIPARPYRVIYICSNQALAEENRRKLALFSDEAAKKFVSAPSFGRLAELGVVQLAPKEGKLLEICTLTPATSFSLTSGDGNVRERFIIHRALLEDPALSSADVDFHEWLERMFCKGVHDGWQRAKDFCNGRNMDPNVLKEFHSRLNERSNLPDSTIEKLRGLHIDLGSWRSMLLGLWMESEDSSILYEVRVRLRSIFVECCVGNLEADLFILDEFQRFRELIETPQIGKQKSTKNEKKIPDTEQQTIARAVLHEKIHVCTLLLSATPFKALSHVDEEDIQQAHVHELEQLIGFLSGENSGIINQYRKLREELLIQLLELPASPVRSGSVSDYAKRQVEEILRPMICRTERTQISGDSEQAVVPYNETCNDISSHEINSYAALDVVEQAVRKVVPNSGGADVMQYSKSAPWCLSFLGDYQMRRHIERYRDMPEMKVALKQARNAWLPRSSFDKYQIDLVKHAPHAKLRTLVRTVMGNNSERMLWMPPSLPYYRSEGPFADNENFTKTLLFSSLVLVPRALSSLISYEAERRLLARREERIYFKEKKTLILFKFDGRSITPAWALIYPCIRLRQISLRPGMASLSEVRTKIRAGLSADFRRMKDRYGKGEPKRGNRWYTLAPFLLDLVCDESGSIASSIEDWFELLSLSNLAKGKEANREVLLKDISSEDLQLGPPPGDLLDYLVDMAIGGPGVCFSRAFSTIWGRDATDESVMRCATIGATAFVEMFNKPDPQRVLKKFGKSTKTWMNLLSYCSAGNFQSVLDEYGHMLRTGSSTGIDDALEAIEIALGLHTVSIAAQTELPSLLLTESGAVSKRNEVRFRCHFAVPLGNQKTTDEKSMARIGHLRSAFNSPFWPFVLNSTSIGQEGLDFHWYCRRVVHWSLPSNPIDLEQRDGRVNRYKSLLVRRRLVEVMAQKVVFDEQNDPWALLFDTAKRKKGKNATDLVPYWHIPGGSTNIERVVAMLPFSREVTRLREILQILSLYRLSFGQPRQQDLLENILRHDYTEGDMSEIFRAMMIDLAPIKYL